MNMAEYCRNAVAGAPMVEKWSEGDAVGIARQGKGFFAMTKRSGKGKFSVLFILINF